MDFERSIRELEKKVKELRRLEKETQKDLRAEIAALARRLEEMRQEAYSNLSVWQIVQVMRHPDRPHTLDYVERIFTDFLEIHGDRTFADDKAVVAGLAALEGRSVGILGTQKGRNTKENLIRNFGMAQPDGYRKALRFMRLCEKFRLPIISFIDTSGAYPGIEGEERSVAEAIARNLLEMSRFRVPIIVSVIGEGGSGGALGIGVGDRILMLENAYYSVISPEGCAAILWRDRGKAEHAAQALGGTAKELLELGVIDEVVPEPLGGAHADPAQAACNLKEVLLRNLRDLEAIPEARRVEERYRKFRAMGAWEEEA